MTVGSRLGHPSDVRSFVTSSDLVLPNCYVGVEAELEQTRSRRLSGLWETKTDGSLHDDGLEYVFAQPLFGEDVVNALTQLEDLFEDNPPSVGNDTSLHVHIDIRDLEFEELWKFIMLYVIYEQILFEYCAPERENNIFCLSTKRARGIIKTYSDLLGTIRDEAIGDVAYVIENIGRYGGMNIRSVTQFGSLEFRGHRGEWRKDNILNWINILMCLKKAAMDDNIPWERPYLLIKDQGAVAFTEYVFGEYASMLDTKLFHDHLHEGMQLARSAVNLYHTNVRTVLQGSRSNREQSLLTKYDANNAPPETGDIFEGSDIEGTRRSAKRDDILERLDGIVGDDYRRAVHEIASHEAVVFIDKLYDLRDNSHIIDVLSIKLRSGDGDAYRRLCRHVDTERHTRQLTRAARNTGRFTWNVEGTSTTTTDNEGES